MRDPKFTPAYWTEPRVLEELEECPEGTLRLYLLSQGRVVKRMYAHRGAGENREDKVTLDA